MYTIDGAQQGVGASSGANVAQVTLTSVLLDPSCRDNPICRQRPHPAGGLELLEQVTVHFHSACDGKADVQGTLGGTHAQKLKLFH